VLEGRVYICGRSSGRGIGGERGDDEIGQTGVGAAAGDVLRL